MAVQALFLVRPKSFCALVLLARVSYFVTELSLDCDIVLENTFLTEYKAVRLSPWYLHTCAAKQSLRFASSIPQQSSFNILTHHTARALTLLGCLLREAIAYCFAVPAYYKSRLNFIVMVNIAVVPHTDVSNGSASLIQ